MIVEEIAQHNLYALTEMMLALWPECSLKEEYANCQRILEVPDETCYLLKDDTVYVAFIQLSIRKEYVEGARSLPVAFVEGIFVNESHRKQGLGLRLVDLGSQWGKERGCTQLASDTELDNYQGIAFHKQVGFQEMNRIVCFLKNIE